MAKFPTYEEMAKNVAEKALDDFLYNGKSIREWMQIIASEDCISRKVVLDLVEDMTDQFGVEHRVITEGVISMLPPITPKPKMGHWINVEDKTDWYDATYKCSCCGREVITPYELKNNLYSDYPYCHCGAKMESEDKE